MRGFLVFVCGCAVLTTLAATPSRGQQPHVAREPTEWCSTWIPDANGTKLPRVLLIGDSISMCYYPGVVEKLKGKASIARLSTSKSLGDPALLTEVALVLDQCRFDVVHFNNGLHGDAYSEAEYANAFPELVATIRKHAPGAKLIWATTTTVGPPRTKEDMLKKNKRVAARNKIAAAFTAKEGIAVDDLCGLMEKHPGNFSDGTHFTGPGVALQAEQVARALLEQIQQAVHLWGCRPQANRASESWKPIRIANRHASMSVWRTRRGGALAPALASAKPSGFPFSAENAQLLRRRGPSANSCVIAATRNAPR